MNPLPPDEYLRKFGKPNDGTPRNLNEANRKQRRAAERARRKKSKP